MIAIDHGTFVGSDDMHAVLEGLAEMAQGRLSADGVDGCGFNHHVCRTGVDKFQCVSRKAEGVKFSKGTPLRDQSQSLLQVDSRWIYAEGMSTCDNAGNHGSDAIINFQRMLLIN